MFTHSKQSVKKIVLRSLSIAIIGSSTVLSFSILGNVCSYVIDNVVICYDAMMKQQLTLP